MKRTLRLRRETLTDLTPSDLTAVVGAEAATARGFTCPAVECVREATILPTCGCLTLNTC
ncbi:MAG TPA: hypothetical protein VNQ77_00165 [Frankiaceae bacterium]|nr:hypothetical protein [Frankiaceae bacterium]